MEQSNQSKKVLLSVIGVAILVVAVVGVSFAFFNYAADGAQNSLSTGKIFFTSSQNQGLSITNFFPTDENGRSESTSSQAVISIEGGTTYERGLDYEVSLVNVSGNLANVPITITQVASTNDLGYTPSTDQGESYLTLSNQATQAIGSGHIAANANAGNSGASGNVTGTITVTAGIASDVAITDTPSHAVTAAWKGTRTVMSTTAWNALATNPVTFNIRVVANETPRPAQP